MMLRELLDQTGRNYFYLMHVSYGTKSSRRPLWEYARKHGLIGLDYGDPDVNRRWVDLPERRRRLLTSTWRRQFEQFSSLENDDCVVVMDGQTHLLGIGLVQDPPGYEFRSELNGFFRHVRKIHWLVAYQWEKRSPARMAGFRNTIVRAGRGSPYWRVTDVRVDLQTKIPALTVKKATSRKEQLVRKYGSGGEGNEHRRLKEYVLEHPGEVGIKNVVAAHEEYEFESGDRADIIFDLPGDRHVVVEIETDKPSPGAFQVLKYKVLKCAQMGLDIKSSRVEAILVAWRRPDNANFCRDYGIRFLRMQF